MVLCFNRTASESKTEVALYYYILYKNNVNPQTSIQLAFQVYNERDVQIRYEEDFARDTKRSQDV